MSVTESNDELDADRNEGAGDSPPQSAASPNELEAAHDEMSTDDTALTGGAGSTDGIEPTSGTALADDPVLTNEPELPNEDAPAPASAQEPTRASAEIDDPATPEQATPTHDRNWMGYAAFATGALALSVVAIVLGHLGLKAGKQGRSGNRDFAFAGLILGYIGLVATGVGLWFALGDQTTAAHVDVQAQQDVSAVGAAAATSAIETGQLPTATLTDTGYLVAGETLDTHLTGERTLTLNGETFSDWCLDIAYEGGEQQAFSYTATSGMAQGRCPG